MEVLLDTCGSPRARYLLLIYIFLLKAAADCPKPEGSKTTVLTNEALLINEFPEGIKVRLECVNGHVKEKGSEFITCMDGKWSEPDLTCKKKDCGPPEPRPHMSFDISAGTLFGNIIRAICDKGYQIRGPSYMTCYSSGWAGKPRCEMVTCEKPTEVINGRNSWNSRDDPQYGEMINFSCNEGYILVGKATIVCSETGEYDSPPPTCEEAPTSSIETTTDSTATATAHRDVSTPMPTVSPSSTETSTDLTATPTPHRDVTTSTPTFPPPAQDVTTEDLTTSKMLTHSTPTPSAQEASSAAHSSATPTAHRDVTTPTPTVSPSARADCPKPEGSKTTVLTNEALLLNEFPEGIKVRLECVNGHVKEKGSEFITCMDGKWSEPDLTCKKKDCGPPKPRPNMSFNIIAGTLFGDKIRAICDKGYQIRGPSYMTCYSSGWAGKPRCEMVTCEKPTEVMNGRNSWNSKDDPQYGEMINYSCNEGYTLVGKATIVCSETGEYDSPPPTCEDLTATPTAHRDVTTPTPTFSPPAQEASSAARSSATPTAHRDVTTPTPTVSPSARGGTDMTGGEREIAATTSVISTTPSSFQEQTEDAVDVKTIALLLCVVLAIVAGILVLCCAAVIWRLLKKRGSANRNVAPC